LPKSQKAADVKEEVLALSNFMVAICPGDLIVTKIHSNNRAVDVQAYKVNDMDHLRAVINKPDKIVSISNQIKTGLRIPNINVTYTRIAPEQIGLYLGYVNIEDCAKICLYYAVLLEKNVYIVRDNSVKLILGKRQTEFIDDKKP
jgi:hypothetical protein